MKSVRSCVCVCEVFCARMQQPASPGYGTEGDGQTADARKEEKKKKKNESVSVQCGVIICYYLLEVGLLELHLTWRTGISSSFGFDACECVL